jgi:hypothetical protein
MTEWFKVLGLSPTGDLLRAGSNPAAPISSQFVDLDVKNDFRINELK